MHNIKNDIKNGIIAGIYILCGEEQFLMDYYAKEIVSAATDEDTKDFNLLEIYNSLPDEETIDSFVSSYPFMSEKKVLVIKDTKIFKRSTESQKAYFSQLITNMPEYLTIVFSEAEIDKRNALYKQISKNYPVCEYEFQDIPTLTSWLMRLLKSHGKDISREDAAYMSEIAGPSMLVLKSEAEKLISFCEDTDTIDRTMIDNLVTRNVENRVFAMIDDIVCKDKKNAMTKLNDLKALNEEPIKIINIIFGKFSTFHKLLLLKDKPIKEICSICSLYEKHARNNLEQAKKLGAGRIAAVMLKCRDMDFAIKNGSTDKWLAVELVIAEAIL